MSLSIHAACVPVFIRGLQALDRELAKAEAHAAEHGLDPADLVQARLAPDMLTLAGQVQRASDTSKMSVERLGGPPSPKMADDETTLADLRARVAATLAYVKGVGAGDLKDDAGLSITLPFGNIPPFTQASYLLTFALPNFLFHVTTAHGILRHKGVTVGKMDYLGPYA